MELVIGKPNGRAISTAFCDKPCSSPCAAATVAPAPRINTATPHVPTLVVHLRITVFMVIAPNLPTLFSLRAPR